MNASARRDQLLDVTTKLVGERGFHGVSIEQVARSAGITRAVVYQHFGDLQTLLEAVIQRETSRALAQVSETALGDLTEGDPTELMLESLRAYLHAVRDHPNTWRLILMAAGRGTTDPPQQHRTRPRDSARRAHRGCAPGTIQRPCAAGRRTHRKRQHRRSSEIE
jgi:AcrR family transcriptional regulator